MLLILKYSSQSFFFSNIIHVSHSGARDLVCTCVKTEGRNRQFFFTFFEPCIVVYLCNNTNEMHTFYILTYSMEQTPS